MSQFFSNEPLTDIWRYRESGYAEKLVNHVLAAAGEEWEVYLHLELSRWKGQDLQIQPSHRKKVVICIGDESARTDYPFRDQVDLIFRMYLPQNQQGNIFHIPVGPSREFRPDAIIPMHERAHNVFFSGNLHGGRAELYRVLAGAPPMPFALLHRLRWLLGENLDKNFSDSIIRFSRGFHNGISPQEYAQYIGNSKIVLCPAGIENPETMRHFEAASLGCIILTKPLPDAHVYRNAPFIVLSSWRELKPMVDQLLREPNRMQELHVATLEWWRSTASAEAVAAYMLHKMTTAEVGSQN
ncbi:hypothetical protein SAMN06265337_2044 [Hymenobacter gelipurpurascens]|uniref:Spore protein YkvP/CgeB glycosyl transferase-like domain-containing protein n=1 Tax=Hymenobacter gelipurpurascens TaxID=89968 RepID=A0A212TP72_9BACT|nr:hypothetical protein [Hymenobacter gelipurpurascens]SNC67710.1 hypothetical protein SAMN06265337_2044 [Hymenobacter gelipurpurascens]